MPTTQEPTAKARYEALSIRREPFLRRAREFASLTIPSILPPEGHTQISDLPETYQGYGARLVNNLSSLLEIAFLPPGQSSFKFSIPSEVLAQFGEDKEPTDLTNNLARAEKTVMSEIGRRQWSMPTGLTLQHLVVTGNAMEYIQPDNTIRVYRLDQYCVVRDPSGPMIEFVIQDHRSALSLDETLADMVSDTTTASLTYPLYTWGKWDSEAGEWEIHQEFEGKEVPNSRGRFAVSPFYAIRWLGIVGEDYGRAKVEDHIGDFRALDNLSKSLIEGSAMAARHITMVRPNAAGGMNLRRRLDKARNGETVVGNPDDVDMLNFKNVNGLEVARTTVVDLKAELGAAFLMNSSARRDAERVTAFELRIVIKELEGVLGGVFATLAGEMQQSRIQRLILQMKAQNKLPPWPDGLVEPTILTGLEALGREKDVERVTTATQLLQGLPPDVLIYVDWVEMLGKAFNGLGIPDAVRTEEEVRQLQEQQATIQAAQQAAGRIDPNQE